MKYISINNIFFCNVKSQTLNIIEKKNIFPFLNRRKIWIQCLIATTAALKLIQHGLLNQTFHSWNKKKHFYSLIFFFDCVYLFHIIKKFLVLLLHRRNFFCIIICIFISQKFLVSFFVVMMLHDKWIGENFLVLSISYLVCWSRFLYYYWE